MAWTSPLTWVVGQLVTAAQMNIHVRDNLQFLYDNRGNETLGPANASSNSAALSSTAINIPGCTVTLTAGKWLLIGRYALVVNTGDGNTQFAFHMNAAGAVGPSMTFNAGIGASNSGTYVLTGTWVTSTPGVVTMQGQKFSGTGTSYLSVDSTLLALRIGP